MAFAGQKVRVVPFVFKMMLQGDGTTTPRYIELDTPEPGGWGPQLEQI